MIPAIRTGPESAAGVANAARRVEWGHDADFLALPWI